MKNKRINPEELAYIAGIIDADGCISLARRKSTVYDKYIRIWPKVDIKMTDKNVNIKMFEFITSKFDDCNIYMMNKKGVSKNCRLLRELSITNRSGIKRFLTAILPYLRIKKKQAEVVLDFIEVRNNKLNYFGTKSSFGKLEWDLWEDIRNLNKLGV